MADDKDQRTEDPTTKRLQEAEEKGQIPSSQEIKTWVIFVATCFLLLFVLPSISGNIGKSLTAYLDQIGQITDDETGYQGPIVGLFWDIFLQLSFVFVTFVVAALIAFRLQNNFIFTLEKLKPDFKKLNPGAGIKKIFSTNNMIELIKALVKMIFVSVVVFMVVYPERDRLDSLMFVAMPDVLELIMMLVTRMFIAVTVLLTVIAALDYTWQTYQHRKSLRMTKQEVKDERKQMDGDPVVKRRLMKIRMQRVARRLTAIIPEADVVITNPTHYAVALKYQHGVMDVPVCVAKGVDSLALRIRELAEEHGVVVMEDPPLARALHASVDIDEEIHPDHYKAVAAIISTVMKLRKSGRAPKPRPRDDGEPAGAAQGQIDLGSIA